MEVNAKQHREILQRIAHKAMLESGLLPDFSTEALADLDRLQGPAVDPTEPVHELGELLWTSIDNDDSLEHDQLTAAEAFPGDRVKILVAVADVDVLAKHGKEKTCIPCLPDYFSSSVSLKKSQKKSKQAGFN
jgi:exoribonuclease-2